MKRSEVGISLNRGIMVLLSLHKPPRIPKSGTNLAGVMILRCTHMPLRKHTNGSNTLYMSNRMYEVVLSGNICLKHDVRMVVSLLK